MKIIIQALFKLALFVIPFSVYAQAPYVPEDLKPWIEWVRERNPEAWCPSTRGQKICEWQGYLFLNLGKTGGTFEYSGRLDKAGLVRLPGGVVNEFAPLWPSEVVNADGKPVPVLAQNERPYTRLAKGDFTLHGRFSWDSPPEEIAVPSSTGICRVIFEGKELPDQIGRNGVVTLRPDRGENTDEAVTTPDTLHWRIFRRLMDGVPFNLQTQVNLEVGGRVRDADLGSFLPSGSVIVEVNSPLAWKLGEDNSLTVQLRPGTWNILVKSYLSLPPSTLTPLPLKTGLGEPQEIWAWTADNQLRSVRIEGATRVDAAHTGMPAAWQSYPAWAIGEGANVSFIETRRGIGEIPPGSLSLERNIWLDENGKGFSVRDVLQGGFYKTWRVNAAGGLEPGRAMVNGKPVLITSDPANSQTGIEVRDENASLTVESRMPCSRSFSASGWLAPVNSLYSALNIPPGWRLLGVSGADSVSGSWIGQWTLFDIFVVLLLAIGFGKVLGWKWGLVSLAGLVLSFSDTGAPFQVWIHLLVARALLQAVGDSKAGIFIRGWFWISFACFVLIFIPYADFQLTTGFFPNLELSRRVENFYTWFLVLAVFILVIAALAALIRKIFESEVKFRKIVGSIMLVIVVLVLFAAGVSILGSPVKTKFAAVQMEADMAPGSMAFSGMAPAPQVMRQSKAAGRHQQLEEMALDKADFDYEHAAIRAKELKQIDPSSLPQTGAGMPGWNWKRADLRWNGAVSPEEKIRLYLLGPVLSLVLIFVKLAAFLALAAALMAGQVRQLKGFFRDAMAVSPSTPIVLFLACMVALAPVKAVAQGIPDEKTLAELQRKLESDICNSGCVTVSGLRLEVSDSEKGKALFHFTGTLDGTGGGFALPGPVSELALEGVELDGKKTTALRALESGLVALRVPEGRHTFSMKARALKGDVVSIQLAENPSGIQVNAPDWITTASRGGIQLMRKVQKKAGNGSAEPEELEQTALTSWVLVKRNVELSDSWRILTSVQRLGGTKLPEVIRVPLLAGESVLSPGVRVEGSQAFIQFSMGQDEQSFSSRFEERGSFDLKAFDVPAMTESWTLKCSEIWQCAAAGIAPISITQAGTQLYDFKPWPGDAVKIEIRKPKGISGKVETVSSVSVNWIPGESQLKGTLSFQLESRQGGRQEISLPEKAVVEEVSSNGQKQQVEISGQGKLVVRTDPGQKNYNVSFKLASPMSAWFVSPALNLGSEAVNYRASVSVPQDRWILFLGGPSWGPAVFFWKTLILILAVAYILSKTVGGPAVHQWILLGLGLFSLPVPMMLVPALWFAALEFRQHRPLEEKWKFNVFQVILVLLTVLAMYVFFEAARAGLILNPDPEIVGSSTAYGRSSADLSWYADRVAADLPQVLVVSLPVWAWRIFMLAWSCWLVFAIMHWIKSGWQKFSGGQIWKR